QQSGFTHQEQLQETFNPEGDEVERLGAAFEEMAKTIADQWGQLKQQDRLRRELVAQVSHDLRTPLAVLYGYLETLNMKQGTLDKDQEQEYLRVALKQSKRLKVMLEDLFELAQLEAREKKPTCEPMPLAELVQDVIQKFQLPAHQIQVRIEWTVPQSPPFVKADFAMTERVLDNLIGNALDHTESGGTVSVSISQQGEQALVMVLDDGEGIPELELEHIFDPFFRKRKIGHEDGHAGLGLAIARRMVELQGGTIKAENSDTGGACFSFTLPLA
ncbi:MAG: HAMP domain-containing sensor histidine kinase, partial [Candidatus Thiodiazotropha sp. 6PDIVS]